MEENYVGFLMNALDPEAQQQVEKHLQENPDAQQRLEALKRALEPLEADKDSIDPPPMLAFRSLARVAEYRCQPLPQAPAPEPAAEVLAGPAPWWRRADVLVAAGLFIAIMGVGIPGLSHLHAYRQRVDCANNLMQYHQAFVSYGDTHNGNYPGFDQPSPHNVAGMFVPILQDAGMNVKKLRCPANDPTHFEPPSVEGLHLLAPEEYEKVADKLCGCFAYSLGYRDPVSGELIGLRRSHPGELDNDSIPVLADRPSVNGDQRGNSKNHNGQNVLHVGGHVKFYTTPFTPDGDDIYRNKHGKVAAGVDRFDTVLGCSGDRP